MKLSDVIMEVQEALECEKQSYKEIEACYGEVTKGWIEALEYVLNVVKNKRYFVKVNFDTIKEKLYEESYRNKETGKT